MWEIPFLNTNAPRILELLNRALKTYIIHENKEQIMYC